MQSVEVTLYLVNLTLNCVLNVTLGQELCACFKLKKKKSNVGSRNSFLTNPCCQVIIRVSVPHMSWQESICGFQCFGHKMEQGVLEEKVRIESAQEFCSF